MATRQPFNGIAFDVRLASKGLLLELRTARALRYKLEYFALGPQGHQRQGAAKGTATRGTHRALIRLDFDPVVGAITRAILMPTGTGRERPIEWEIASSSLSGPAREGTSSASTSIPSTADPYGRPIDQYGTYAEQYGVSAEQYGVYGVDPYGMSPAKRTRNKRARKGRASRRRPRAR